METIRTPRRQVDLIHGPIFKNLILFAIPIFISNGRHLAGGGGRLRLDL